MKYVLGIFGFIILTILAVVLLASANNSRSSDTQEGDKVVNLTDYIDNGTVEYSVQGPITGNETYYEIRISVNRSARRVQVINGYNGQVQKEQTFANNQEAFDAFMHALNNAGFSRERAVEVKDMRGVCALGNRYVYELNAKGEKVTELWSTNCGRKEGTFGGNVGNIDQLFENQIPEYQEFTSEVQL